MKISSWKLFRKNVKRDRNDLKLITDQSNQNKKGVLNVKILIKNIINMGVENVSFSHSI